MRKKVPDHIDDASGEVPIDRRRFLQVAGVSASLTALPAAGSAASQSDSFADWAASQTGRPSSLETDGDGWTVLEKSADTRTIYVSRTEGDNDNDGTSPDDPVKTLEAGIERLRDGYPDWLCLRSGDVWRDEDLYALAGSKSGRSDTERIVVTSYGEGPRPRIEPDGKVMWHHDGTWRNVAFVGIDFYAARADPDNPDFAGAAETGFSLVEMQDLSNVLWEDCRIRYFGYGLSLSGHDVGDLSAIEFRRCLITDCWDENSYYDDEKAQGMWNSHIDGFLVEECLWDRNGHNPDVDGAGANQYNHNLYMSANNDNVAVRRNVFARGAAQGLQLRGGGVCRNNLFVRNAVGMNVGYFGDMTHDAHVFDNVVLEGRLMDPDDTDWPRTGALWGIWIHDVPGYDVLVEDNVIAHSIHDGGTRRGINVDYEDATIRNNVVYEWEDERNDSGDDWTDPDRSVADYHASIGGAASLEAFLENARDRGPGEWDARYAAPAVNDFVRAGFGRDDVPEAPYGSDVPDEGDDTDDSDDGELAPQNLTLEAVSITMASLEWTPPEAAVDHYVVDVDGTEHATVDDPSVVVTGLEPATTHEIGVRAVADDTESARATVALETDAALTVTRTGDQPTIDGTLGDPWEAVAGRAVPYRSLGSDSDLEATARFLWDDDALYAFVTVEDDALVTDPDRNPWEDDSIELFVDADASAGESYGDTDVQYLFRVDDSTVHTGPFGLDDASGVDHAFVETEAGYRLEVAVPWSTLGATPDAGSTIGLDIHVNDNDGGDSRDAKYAINDLLDEAASRPDRFGVATLSEDDSGGNGGSDDGGSSNSGSNDGGRSSNDTSGGSSDGSNDSGDGTGDSDSSSDDAVASNDGTAASDDETADDSETSETGTGATDSEDDSSGATDPDSRELDTVEATSIPGFGVVTSLAGAAGGAALAARRLVSDADGDMTDRD